MLSRPLNLVSRYIHYTPKTDTPEILNKQASVTWSFEDYQAIANLTRDFHQELDKVSVFIAELKKIIPENQISNLIPLVPLYDYPLTESSMKTHQRIHNNAYNASSLLEFPSDSFDPLMKGR